ncbi:MAG: proline reductase-associated electron transfer protein PrdC [Defluviitaleaceae bacterium]|nr:proline reductase-associated electron transfer protein PrdC [Defluviitaleaceae bacterium]
MASYVIIELKQHVGAVACAVVVAGDKVKKGQLVAVCDGLGANIHSSVYGVASEILADCIKIKMDEHQPEEYVKIKDTPCHLEAIKEAGIVGAGGAGFPAHVKFGADLRSGTFILNAAECEPVLGHNLRVLQERADEIVRGMQYVMDIVNAKTGIIAIKSKHTKELIKIAKACKDKPNIRIEYLPDVYPIGDERAIVREVLGITLKPGQLPMDAGALVSNVETIKRVVEAIELRKPVITKDFTVSGRLKGLNTSGQRHKVYLDEPIGMPVKKYIDDCDGFLEPYGEILLGGPFTGASGSENSVITKTLGGIFVSMPFPNDNRKFGILACECGAGEARLKEIAAGMGGKVVAETKCKRMVEVNGRFRCDEPGNCPGQAEKILELKRAGAQAILAGSCED